jgi:chromosome segregation ATPase
MMPLEVGDVFVDRHKSSIMLSYLAKAALRMKRRDLRKEKMEVGLRHLKHLNTSELKKHISGLEHHVEKAAEKQDLITERQSEEDSAHKEFNTHLTKIHKKVNKFLDQQEKIKRNVEHLEKKSSIKHKKADSLKQNLRTLKLVFNKAKMSKHYSKAQLDSVKKRIEKIEKELKEF